MMNVSSMSLMLDGVESSSHPFSHLEVNFATKKLTVLDDWPVKSSENEKVIPCDYHLVHHGKMGCEPLEGVW